MKPASQDRSLALIAASLALPHVEAQLAGLRRKEPTGNTAAADEGRRHLAERRAPLLRRRAELMAVIMGEDE